MSVRERVGESSGASQRGARRAAGLLLLLLVVAVACSTPPSSRPSSGAEPADASSSPFVTLARGTHPLARPDLEIGRLPPDQRIENLSLVFKLSAGQLADRDALVASLTFPGSPQYHRWLTPEGYAARFGARTSDIDRTVAWLEEQGLEVKATPSRLGARVMFAGTVAALEAAFRTEMKRYLVRGEAHYAMSPAPSIPRDLEDIVLAIHNSHDFYPRHGKTPVTIIPDALCPSGGMCSGSGIAPPDWATIYDVKPLYTTGVAGTPITGAGVTIAVVGIAQISQTDLTSFRTRYGLATNPITMTLVPNTGAARSSNGSGLEAVLDTEWSGAIAPAATINYVYTGANDGNVDDATYYAIEQNLGAVLSESWGGCEQGLTPGDADVVETFGSAANLLGITYVASSGDDGAAGCQGKGGLYVNIPAAFPGVTSVGGTGFAIPGGLTFDGSGNVAGFGAEAVWNEYHDAYTANGIASGGGGISSVFARPTYQSGIPTCTSLGALPTGVTPSSMREVPDVALTAASGISQYAYFVECTYDSFAADCSATGTDPVVLSIGGTSASTPSFAGVMALANQATGGRLGNVNPLLYALDASVPSPLRDVTTGNNEVTCKTATDPGCPAGALYGYAAVAGYDCASGLGSIDATNLVSAWATLAPTATSLSPSVTTTSEGQSVTLDATVEVVVANASALGGLVTFTFQSYLANGAPDLSWTLGTGAIANGTTTSGTTSLSIAIPPGLVTPSEAVDVVAMYGGDAHHAASVSAKNRITFSPTSTLCVSPATNSVAAGASFTYSSGGGVPAVRFYIDSDSTCNSTGTRCSTLDENTGAFTAGTGAAGFVLVGGVDADGAEVFSEVTVGSPSGTAPWAGDAGILTNACFTPITSCPAGDNCGTVPNGCGGTVNCGTCTAPQTCAGGGTANVCGAGCTPTTSCPAGDNCGTVPNGCGGTVNCGSCTAPQTCAGGGTPNVCGCTPTSSCPAGNNCGTIPNGCGGTLSCGTCTAPQTCTANVCGCSPITSCPAGDDCGTVPNGCGGTLSCGTCTAPQICTGNVCGCSPITSCPAGDNCGTIPNGCGGTLSCGACSAPQTCAGGGTGNVCGCSPITSCPAGDNCGTVPNGCGGMLSCGSCIAPETCAGGGTANVCGCTPFTSCPAGDNCGTIPDGCGGAVSCGSCTAPQTCGGGGTANVCGATCTPITSCPAGDNCGTVPDGCGGTLSCPPGCGSSQTCSSNHCVEMTVDSGTAVDSGSARLDSGARMDSGGGTALDSGHITGLDSGGGPGSDSGGAGLDSGMAIDSGRMDDATVAAGDSGTDAGSADGGADPTIVAGCGCRTAKPAPPTPTPALAGFSVLSVLLLRRVRRRKGDRQQSQSFAASCVNLGP